MDLREDLAEYAHKAWCGWMDYMFSKCFEERASRDGPGGGMLIPSEFVQRWKRQAATAYEDLPESEQKSDSDEADKIYAVISRGFNKRAVDAN
jgi:hypothetical protein